MSEGIYINDREYFYYRVKGNKYILVSNYDDIYDGDILEVELLGDNIQMKLRRFEGKVLKAVCYIKQVEDNIDFKYYSKERQNLYANEHEQKSHYLISLILHENNESKDVLLKLKLDGRRPFKFKETNTRYVFVDNDGDEFKITARAIAEAKQFISFIIPSITEFRKFIQNLNGKQKKI